MATRAPAIVSSGALAIASSSNGKEANDMSTSTPLAAWRKSSACVSAANAAASGIRDASPAPPSSSSHAAAWPP